MKSRGRSTFLALGILIPACAQSIQYGIRLNSLESIQWSGESLYVEGTRRAIVQPMAGFIHDIWPGPVPGSFSIHTSKGLGVLAGRDAVILAKVVAPAPYLLRSVRPEVLWVGSWQREKRTTKIAAWQANGAGRLLVESNRPVVDFDVTPNGTVGYLHEDGSFYVKGPGQEPLRIPHPLRQPPLRVFLHADLGEFALLSRSEVCRLVVATGKWTSAPFDPTSQAVVRHIMSGRPALEERFREQD